jgi:predicted  nucleic acid-binding Zn-ribbon protein
MRYLSSGASSAEIERLSSELERERLARESAEAAVQRARTEREQLKGAVYQLQEAMKSLDSTGQVEEMLKQVREGGAASGRSSWRAIGQRLSTPENP